MDTVPSARNYPLIASSGDLTFLWGGEADTEPETVFIHHHDTETWTRCLTSGPHPPAGLRNGGYAISEHNLYVYGGRDKNEACCGDLYELNTQTWQWRKLSDGSAGGPGKKWGCRIVLYQDLLLVVGGYYNEVSISRQAGARYERNKSGTFTNEVHGYSLTTDNKCSWWACTKTCSLTQIIFSVLIHTLYRNMVFSTYERIPTSSLS